MAPFRSGCLRHHMKVEKGTVWASLAIPSSESFSRCCSTMRPSKSAGLTAISRSQFSRIDALLAVSSG